MFNIFCFKVKRDFEGFKEALLMSEWFEAAED